MLTERMNWIASIRFATPMMATAASPSGEAARTNATYTTENSMPMSAAGTPTRASPATPTEGPGARRASGNDGCRRQASTA